MNWEQLLSDARWGASHRSTASPQKHRSNYDRDYGRILFSSAFRRLQDKTQVFPLGRNDYVRTRLTHSLEVAHIGASLGMLAGEWLAERGEPSGPRSPLRPGHHRFHRLPGPRHRESALRPFRGRRD